MKIDEYRGYDAVGLAGLVASRAVSPDELLDAAIERLHAVNPRLNAVVQVLESAARRALADGLPQGPFSGVPFLLKDVTTQLAGAVTSAGSRTFAHARALDDSALVAKYKRAGFVIFGKTNTPEFGLVGVTEPELWGATLNPWSAARTCGGSSGGAASAVAGGIVPAAQGSDGGGSIRIPASCCGLFGLKPSRGRVSMAPQGEGWGGLTVLHALTRSVRDSAAILDATCTPEPGDPYWLAPPSTPFAAEVDAPPGCLRIGLLSSDLHGRALEPACEAAVREAALLCQSLGHQVEEISPPGGLEALADNLMRIIGPSVASNLDREALRRGRAIGPDEIEPLTKIVYDRARKLTGADYAAALQALHGLTRRLASWSAPYDVVMLSTLGTLPLPLGLLKEGHLDVEALSARFSKFAPNTQIFNVTGQPAMSVPLGWSADGLPVGVQFAARMGEEATLFRLAGQLEKARPWFDRTPAE